mgnify:CR=1 FL=1
MTGVLVTRAEPGASQTAQRLIDLGYSPVIAPLLEIATVSDAEAKLDGVQAVLFSSPNGARAFADLTERTNLPALCVGEATARAAREAGFDDVRSAGGDGGDLAALARLTLDPAGGTVLWASGAHVSTDLGALLSEGGFAVRRAAVYRADCADCLPPAAREAIADRRIAAVLFHSARAARTFAELATDAGLAHAAADLAAVCISARVAEAAGALDWGHVEIAAAPDEDALLAALERAAGAGRA